MFKYKESNRELKKKKSIRRDSDGKTKKNVFTRNDKNIKKFLGRNDRRVEDILDMGKEIQTEFVSEEHSKRKRIYH